MIVWDAYKTKVRCLCFSPDGKQLASVAEKGCSNGMRQSGHDS